MNFLSGDRLATKCLNNRQLNRTLRCVLMTGGAGDTAADRWRGHRVTAEGKAWHRGSRLRAAVISPVRRMTGRAAYCQAARTLFQVKGLFLGHTSDELFSMFEQTQNQRRGRRIITLCYFFFSLNERLLSVHNNVNQSQ